MAIANSPPDASSPPGEKATAGVGSPSVSPANVDTTVTAPEQDTTNPQRFGPGLGKAIFSTDLCARAPRSLGSFRPPVIARSATRPDPEYFATVVQEAHHWQHKYKSQCLCIFPGQGWIVEDLWDAEDIHVEGRAFCEEMLTFIARDTYYGAKKFAEDWMRAHPDRLDSLGGDMGNINNVDDPLAIVDSIFIFHETEDFPRGFLWHVAYMMRTTMNELSQVNATASDAARTQPSHVEQRDGNEKGKAEEVSTSSMHTTVAGKKNRKQARSRPSKLTASAESSSVARTSAHVPTMPAAVPYQPNARPTLQQRIPSHVPPLSGGYHPHSKGYKMEMQPMTSPSVHPRAMNVPMGSRNMGYGPHNQPPMQHGWTENASHEPSGPYPRQFSGNMSNMHSPHFVPAAMAMGGQSMMVPGFPGNPMPPYSQVPYGQAPPMGPLGGQQVPYLDPHMASRGQLPFQPGPMHAPPGGQPFMPHPSYGAPTSEMANNMYYANNMEPRYTDPRASVGRRTNHRNTNTLYDPNDGTYRKFSDTAGHQGSGKKAGSNTFPPQYGGPRGRKASASNVRPAYNNTIPNANHHMSVASSRTQHSDRRLHTDDPTITGDLHNGCNQDWIGSANMTVRELWIGDLPLDVTQDEIKHLFQEKVGILPMNVSINHNAGKVPHAFVTFNSPEEAKSALKIREQNPRLRGSRPIAVTVPKRYYRKDSSPASRRELLTSNIGYSGQTHAGQTDERATHGVARMSSQEETAIVDMDEVSARNGKPLYSPQDARSGLRKKATPSSGSDDLPRTGSPETQKSKRQQASPTKHSKSKQPLDKSILSEEASKPKEGSSKAGPTQVDAQNAANAPISESSPTHSTSSTQDKFTTENLPREAECSTGDIQAQTLEPVPLAQQSVDVVKSEDVKTLGSAPEDSSPPPADEPANDAASDDEAKNDASFVSAKEDVEPQSQVQDVSIDASQGVATSPLPSTEKSPDVADSTSLPMPAGKTKVHQAQELFTKPKDQDAVVRKAEPEAQGAIDSSESHETPQPAVQAADAHDKTTLPIANTETARVLDTTKMTISTQSSLVAVAKKTGAHQVESLSPFAKIGKSSKKGKQKKEQKAAKSKASAKAKDTTTQTQSAQLAGSGDSTIATDRSAKPTTSTAPTNAQTALASKDSKGKAKANTTDQEDTVKVGGEVSGKPNSGTATKAPKEIASVTQKTSIAETTNLQSTNQGSLTASGDPFTGRDGSPSVSPHVSALSKETQTLSNEKTPTPAVNHLHPSSNGASTHSQIQGLQLDSNLGPPPMFPTTSSPQPDMSPFIRPSRRSSNSSATLRPDDDPISTPISYGGLSLISAPMAALLAVTGDTTSPIGLSQQEAHQNDDSKKKKKRNNKKKKKAPATTPTEEIARSGGNVGDDEAPPRASSSHDGEEDEYSYDPFQAQMSHVDSLRSANARKPYDDLLESLLKPLRDMNGGKTGLIPNEESPEALMEQLSAFRRENPEQRPGAKTKLTTEQNKF